jgi:hypothetical protein
MLSHKAMTISTNSAPIIPDISGNGGYVLQVNTGATATQWADFDSLTRRKGEVNRAIFEYVNGTSIKVYPGIYDLDAKGKNVSWDSALTVTGLSGTNQWVYIYLDYSAITGTTVTASDIIGSTSTPSWNDAKHGWYNGDDRCIFAVYFDGSNIQKFYHDGGSFVFYDEDYEEFNVAVSNPIRRVWNSQSLVRVPVFALEAELTYKLVTDAGETYRADWYWRVSGSSSTGHALGSTEGGDGAYDDEHVSANVRSYVAENFSDTSKSVEWYCDSDFNDHRITAFSNGFYFPQGM